MRQRFHATRRTAVMVTAASIAILAAATLLLTWVMHGELRARILQREAESLRAMVDLSQRLKEDELVQSGLGANVEDWFPILLETARLRGVVALRLYDADGNLRDALPGTMAAADPTAGDRATLAAGGQVARLRRFDALGVAEDPVDEAPSVPLVEVLVPVRLGGMAQYWIDGSEFAALDRSVWRQGATALAVGAAVLLMFLGWTFLRLEKTNRELEERSVDLARANQEFSLAAKTSALGAITAHLIHGLKNPLAGLEGYVTSRPEPGAAGRGDEWQAAMETTRRLRSLVNEVVAILREEEAGGAGFALSTAELVAEAGRRVGPLAGERGVDLSCRDGDRTEVPSRRANLVLLILDNLLRNACEASGRGRRVVLGVSRTPGEIAFSVEDEGGGLPPEVAEKLFQPVTSGKPGGGGIGLVISRHLAQHAGGRLELVRSDARGCCFRLTIPG